MRVPVHGEVGGMILVVTGKKWRWSRVVWLQYLVELEKSADSIRSM